jgi:class 3 adenylate cyclase
MERCGRPRRILALVGVCDLQGYLQLAESMPQIELFELLQAVSSIASRRLRPQQGRLVKHLGDGFLFLFPEKAADQGVRTALALKSELEQLLRSRAIANRFGLGIAFGQLTVGRLPPFRTMDLIGGPVNAAFSLLRHAAGNRLLITQEAFQKIKPETQRRFRPLEGGNIYQATGDGR